MLDRLTQLVRRLHDTVMEWVAVDVEYLYGGESGHRLSLRAGMLEVDVDERDAQGGLVTSRRTDFLIDSSDLVVNGRRRVPQEADLIRVPFSGVRRRTYEVAPVASDSHYHPTDAGDSGWRVHTRMIAEE